MRKFAIVGAVLALFLILPSIAHAQAAIKWRGERLVWCSPAGSDGRSRQSRPD
jgi:hypothetical protein